MYQKFFVFALIFAFALAAQAAVSPTPDMIRVAREKMFDEVNMARSIFTPEEHARVMFGRLGRVAGIDEASLVDYLRSHALAYGFTGTEQFEQSRVVDDAEFDRVHVRFDMSVRGTRVAGGDFYLHINVLDLEVVGFTGGYAVDGDERAYNGDTSAFVDVEESLALIEREVLDWTLSGDSLQYEHVVYVDNEPYAAHSAFEVKVDVLRSDGMRHPALFYLSTDDGRLLGDVSLIAYALDRSVYNDDHLEKLPGRLVLTEGDPPSTDKVIDAAYDNAGVVYNFYMDAFGRDSYDGKGAPIISTVHYGKNYSNAFWNGQQMAYGDGDGVTFIPFAYDLSVVGHELTHAVVSHTSNLRYIGQSGALNEGIADIFGATIVAWHQNDGCMNPGPRTWAIGDVCYIGPTRPDAPFPALRYMNNPPLDGVSRNYFPDRYTGIQDNGGVHLNSGIANQQAALLTQGGVLPQLKESAFVNGVGMTAMARLWYQANTKYMTSTSNFLETAKIQEEVVSVEIKDPAVMLALQNSWIAVGVLPKQQ